MIAAWMLHAVAVALLCSAAGLALDRLVRPHRRPVRWIWLGTLVLGAGLPLLRLVAGSLPSPATADLPAALHVTTLEAIRPTVGAASPLHSLDPILLGAWALLTFTLLALALRAALRLHALRRKSHARRIGDVEVLVSPDLGPAVTGVLRPRVVLPAWMLEEGSEALELAILHEREHVRSRDPLVVGLGAIVPLLFPWNPLLWWAFHRLREAVEVDCDARVLAHRPDALRSYARILLDVGRRHAGLVSGLAPALTQPRSFLERRIRAMTSTPPSRPVLRALGLGGLALLAFVGACLAPDAREGDGTLLDVDGSQAAISEPPGEIESPAQLTVAPDVVNSREVVQALDDEYPPLLRKAGIEGTATVWMHVDRTGAVLETRIRESAGHRALDQAALDVAEVFELTPPRNESGPVDAWIALPVSFVLD